ncbi:hypothetical protein CFN78_02745 [Amycolatopsis antarctica]|uniref:Uncharacterized protein n=1 Tax=Amycolatopsis antarctica TaxID=1854586 RepID=A0A263D9G4_9PSEU|nr:hypothetical protein [Amycolatopsis antarctica]OZM75103.1 hypothetical protein CFN78_02745 [Amycolatopsis antarctica]
MPKRGDPTHVDGSDRARARRWLTRHRAGTVEPSDLLAARLAIRARGSETEMFCILAFGGLVFVWAILREVFDLGLLVGPERAPVDGPLVVGALYLGMAVTAWIAGRRMRAEERRLATALPRRSAHSSPPSWRHVVGTPFLYATALTYGGGTAIGAVVASTGSDPAVSVVGGLFAAGTFALGIVVTVAAVDSVRRPGLAEDDSSLVVDDQLRTEDAHRVAPMPLALAAIMLVQEGLPAAAGWTFTVYLVLGAALWTSVHLRDRRRPLAVGRAMVTP